MTKSRSSLATIPAEKAQDAKPWNLPFWTEEPVWVSQKIDKDFRKRKKPRLKADAALPKEPEPTEEIETLEASSVNLPTADEIETIRREAYNAGLEQGLLEGRQKGQQEGFEQGHQEGYQAAFAEGQQAGHAEGLKNGLEMGQRKAQTELNATVNDLRRVEQTLLSRIQERDEQLPEILAALVASMCSKVLDYELQDGAVNIHSYVERAMAQLPEGSSKIKIFIGPDDAKHLDKSLAELGKTMHYQIDQSLPAGSCRVESEHSLVDYSSQEYLGQMLENVLAEMMQTSLDYPLEGEADLAPEQVATVVSEQAADAAPEQAVFEQVAEQIVPAPLERHEENTAPTEAEPEESTPHEPD